MPPAHRSVRLACCLALLGAALVAQRPRSAGEALARYEQVRDRAEAERRRAVDDLGGFADAEVTAALVAELGLAKELGYRQVVVRALGRQTRDGAVPALQAAFEQASNARLCDSVAEGLARQGDAGIGALATLLEREPAGSSKWNSLCGGMGQAETVAARDALLTLLRKVGGRDRLPPLRNLRRWTADATVDEQRLLLARDKDPLVAATLALELHRRLGDKATPEQHSAALQGLLLAPTTATLDALLGSAAAADDPFAELRQPLWHRALGDAAFVQALADAAPGRKAVPERAVAATALQFVDPAQAEVAAAALRSLLGQRDADVVRAAAASLVLVAPDRAAEALPPLVATAADPLAAIALEALHTLRTSDASWPGELLPHATGRTPGLRATALQLLARCPDLDATAALAAARAGLPHKAWNVRAAAITLLVALRTADVVPLLFERLDAEQARLRADLTAALKELTGQQFPSTSAWRDWWAKEAATFAVLPHRDQAEPRRGEPGTTASYWDLPVVSDRVVFVVDVSGSMNQPFGTGDATRLDEAKRQLVRVLAALPAKAKANIVAFGNDAQGFAAGLQAIDDRRRKAAATWTDALQARGATNVHAALQLAFADNEADTIFLLTDGRPSAGSIVVPEALAREVQRWNVDRGLRIHTVALGGRSDFLERLATDSGGEHTVAR
jgi:Mg-chelatase subunit ChlD